MWVRNGTHTDDIWLERNDPEMCWLKYNSAMETSDFVNVWPSYFIKIINNY